MSYSVIQLNQQRGWLGLAWVSSHGSKMTELPVYPPESANRTQALARKRNLVLEGAPAQGEALRDAIAELVVDCVFHTLRLTGEPVERETVVGAARGSDDLGDSTGPEEDRRLIRGQIAALELLEREARQGRLLSTDLLCAVHRFSSPPADGRFRSGATLARFAAGKPSRPDLIAATVANLLDWLAADSGRGLHPVERAALAFPRILEIAPFERSNFRTAHLLLSFFAFAEGYPPFFLLFEEAEAVREEIERAMVFDTAPLMTRFAEALGRSLDRCLAAISAGPTAPSAGRAP